MKAGFVWACEFGRTSVVEFLLHSGTDVKAKLNQEGGETGLHWAAFAGHADIVRLLLEHGAPVDVNDKRHGGTPLDWTLYGWGTSADGADRRGYYEVVGLLARTGARLDPQWYEEVKNRQGAAKKVQSDPRMLAALRGEMPASVGSHAE
jgi:hypothetical protein